MPRVKVRDATGLDLVFAEDVRDHARQIHWHGHGLLDLDLHDLVAQRVSILLKLLELISEHFLKLAVVHDLCGSLPPHRVGQLLQEGVAVSNLRNEVALAVELLVIKLG